MTSQPPLVRADHVLKLPLRRASRRLARTLAAALWLPLLAMAQSWDMPTGYAPTNFHTVNNVAFAGSA